MSAGSQVVRGIGTNVIIHAHAGDQFTSRLAFADVYLAVLAPWRQCTVYTKNVRELEGQGVAVPQSLSEGQADL